MTPKASWPWVRALLHWVYDQPDAPSVHAQFDRVLDALAGIRPVTHTATDANGEEVTTSTIPTLSA